MKTIQSSNKKNVYAKVDDDVFDVIQNMGLKFSVQPNGYFQSTSHMIKLPGMMKKKRLYLHHFVLILKTNELPNSTIDHIDRDPGNNQFENLRLASRREQSQNRGKQKNNTSGYIGVCHQHYVDKRNNKKYEKDYWKARIRRPDGKNEQKCFSYTDEGKRAAGKYYDQKVREYFGEFHGQLNFPDENK